MNDRKSRARREQRAREIEDQLKKLDRGIYPDEVIGKWGTVARERLARFERSLVRELIEITRVDGSASDECLYNSPEHRAANLRQLGLGPDGRPISEVSCRTPCSVARWPRGRWGTEWASGVGSPRYSDRGLDCTVEKSEHPGRGFKGGLS